MKDLVSGSTLVDQQEWHKVLDAIKDKKIVVFGAGNNGEMLIKLLPFQIAYFIDNAKQKWGQTLNNIAIHSPEILKTEKDDVIVLVGGYLYADMIHQLNSFELGDNIRIFNVYKILEREMNQRSFLRRGEDLIEFFERSSSKYIDNNGLLSKQKISVIVSNFLFATSPWYLTTIAVLLRLTGNNVDIVWDDLEGYDELFYDWNDATIIQNKVIEKVLSYVQHRFDIKVIKISDMKEEPLDEVDRAQLEKLALVNTTSKFRTVSMDEKFQNYTEKCLLVLEKNLQRVKYLFNNIKIDRIISFTGLHGKTGLYTWAAQRKNIQVCSYDMVDSGLLVSTDGPSNHQMDIKKVIEEGYLRNGIRAYLVSYAKKEFDKRIKAINSIENISYQVVEYSRTKDYPRFDVIIPLNVSWDGAALGKHRHFVSTEEWVLSTVEYILENTSASVAVRQHPVERRFTSGKDLELKLKEKFQDHPRFAYISATDKINTYNLIESSKLVLPHTSTTGIEAALLKKPIILESDAYYAERSFAQKAESRKDYYEKINKCLIKNDYTIDDKNIEEALLCYGLVLLNVIKTDFTLDDCATWSKKSLEDLMEDKAVEKILLTFAMGKPVSLSQLEEAFKESDFLNRK